MKFITLPSSAMLLLVAQTYAADLSIRAFHSTFAGGAVAENADSVYFATTAWDADVVIKTDGTSGF